MFNKRSTPYILDAQLAGLIMAFFGENAYSKIA